MKIKNKNSELNKIFIIIFISFLFFFGKWIITLYYYPNEDIYLKIIYEIKDNLYLPIIKSFSEFNLSPSYNSTLEESNNDKIIAFPFLSLIIYSFFLKIIGPSVFIFLELISIIIFLQIFYLIFRKSDFNHYESLIIACFLFILPCLFQNIDAIKIFKTVSINFSNFYDTRIPRPQISNLYLFIFLLFIINLKDKLEFDRKNSVIFGLLLGITLNSFYYFFIFEIIMYLLFLVFTYKKETLRHIWKEKVFYTQSFSVFIIFFIFFFIQIKNSDPDYIERLGVKLLDYNSKFSLIKYYINFITNKFFIINFIINFLIFKFIKKSLNLEIFYAFYLSTIISTIIFIICSDRAIDLYHFFNWIIITGILYPLICLIKLFLYPLRIKIKKKFIYYISILFFIIFYNFNNFLVFNKNNYERKEYNFIIKHILEKNLIDKNDTILTFDPIIFSWLIFKEYKKFHLVPVSFWSIRKTSEVEINLIKSFKVLNLDIFSFKDFLKNEHSNWRIKNNNVERFFDRIYMANQIYTFNNSRNFTKEELFLIKKASPIITHQLAIPKEEFLRLNHKFLKTSISKIDLPNLIIYNKNHYIFKKSNANKIYFSEIILENSNFKIYKKK